MQPNNKLSFSFEIFPPKTEEGLQLIEEKSQQLNLLGPSYISVTFGAAGSAQPQTERLVRHLVGHEIPTVPHISCINMSKSRMTELLEQYKKLGITQLVVIRGDYPSDHKIETADFKHASDLVTFIRATMGEHFHLTVAAYPEYHPQAQNPLTDLKNFQRKVAAGANSAITQYFFSSDAYLRFVENCEKLKIYIPIIPGIMPIHDYSKLLRFSASCGAEVPSWIRKNFEDHSYDADYIYNFGIEVITKLCQTLITNGAKKLHFYTLNHTEPSASIIKNLGLAVNNVLLEPASEDA